MDHTQTPFGSRLLRRWLTHPLTDMALIRDRLEAVNELKGGVTTTSDGAPGLSEASKIVASRLNFGLECSSEFLALNCKMS